MDPNLQKGFSPGFQVLPTESTYLGRMLKRQSPPQRAGWNSQVPPPVPQLPRLKLPALCFSLSPRSAADTGDTNQRDEATIVGSCGFSEVPGAVWIKGRNSPVSHLQLPTPSLEAGKDWVCSSSWSLHIGFERGQAPSDGTKARRAGPMVAAAFLLVLSSLSERHGCSRDLSVADMSCGMQEVPVLWYLAPMMLERGGWLP